MKPFPHEPRPLTALDDAASNISTALARGRGSPARHHRVRPDHPHAHRQPEGAGGHAHGRGIHHRGKALQVDSVKTSVEGAYGFRA